MTKRLLRLAPVVLPWLWRRYRNRDQGSVRA